jgi:predicted KAP-like P-loop ATPase
MWHDNETTRDLIGFKRFADTIASLVTDREILPVTIGLFGDWGSGKSSVLRMVEDRLAESNSVLTLRFDGWLFEGYDDAKAALMTTVIDQLTNRIKDNQSLWEKIKPRVTSMLKRINWFRAVGLAAKGVLTLTSPVGAAAVAGLTVADAIGFLAQRAHDPHALEGTIKGLLKEEAATIEEMHESIREFRSEFSSLIEGAGITILVVLIDDLDRCLPESIVSTLEAIKLFLSVPGTAFVIAADERIVRQAISRRYPPEAYHEFDIAQEYLDKLVQMPCIIPPMDEVETETYIYLLFAEQSLEPQELEPLYTKVLENRKNPSLSQPLNFGIAKSCIGDKAVKLETDFALAARIAPILGKNLGGNPRLVKRFLNTFSLRIRLAQTEGIRFEHGILAKIMVLERFHRDRFEELYKWQAEQHGVPGQITTLEIAINDTKGKENKGEESYFAIWLGDPDLRDWLRLDPPLADTNLGPYFHLARESLKVKLTGGRRLSQEQQELFAALQSGSRAAQQNSARLLSKKTADEIYSVYEALWSRVEVHPHKSKALDGLIELAYVHEGTAKRLLKELQKLSPVNIEASIVPRVGQISQHHPQLTSELNAQLSAWAQSSAKTVAKAAEAVLKVRKK